MQDRYGDEAALRGGFCICALHYGSPVGDDALHFSCAAGNAGHREIID